jgi:polyisoprenyl-phosphate glycosyltransferase
MNTVSFVLPIYNEEKNIPRLWSELLNLKKEILNKYSKEEWKFEFIFVSDGSKDKSNNVLIELYNNYLQEVKLLIFGRNFGHQIAVTAGQDVSSGDIIIIMDTDLQDPPIICLDLIDEWKKGFEIVYAKRRTYKISLIKRIPAFLFYRLMTLIASIEIPEDTGDFRLISKNVNAEMKKFREKNRFLRGISFLTGYSTSEVLFDRSERYKGKPVYTFTKSLKLAFDGITSFSLAPIRLVSILGSILSLFSFIFMLTYVGYSYYYGVSSQGWASLMVAILFLGGLQLLMLGVLGEYIGRIYIESLERPLYTVVKSYGVKNQE